MPSSQTALRKFTGFAEGAAARAQTAHGRMGS
jgi:hypothetical protein